MAKKVNGAKIFIMWFIMILSFAYLIGLFIALVSLAKDTTEVQEGAITFGAVYIVGFVLLLLQKLAIDRSTMLIHSGNIVLLIILTILYPIHVFIATKDNLAYVCGCTAGYFEKKFSFDILSIQRTFTAVFVSIITILIFVFGDFIFKTGVFIDNEEGRTALLILLIISFSIVLIDHIIYDVLDFEQRDSRGLRLTKNIIFWALTGIALAVSIVAYFTEDLKANDLNFFGYGYMTFFYTLPLTIQIFYYIYISRGTIPNKMTGYMPAFATLCNIPISILGGVISSKVGAVLFVIYLVVLCAVVGVLSIFKRPFFVVENNHYRTQKYQNLGSSSTSSGSSAASTTVTAGSNLKKETSFGSSLISYMRGNSTRVFNSGYVTLRVTGISPNVNPGLATYNVSYIIEIYSSGYVHDGNVNEYLLNNDIERVKSEYQEMCQSMISRTLSKIESLATEYVGYGGRSWKVSVSHSGRTEVKK